MLTASTKTIKAQYKRLDTLYFKTIVFYLNIFKVISLTKHQ